MAKTAPRAREQWSGQLGFLFAAIGSAIGLGNIWRFPGVAYSNGGGAFILPYIIALLTAGIPILLLDYAVGHRFRGSAPASFRRISRKLEALGWFQVAICFVISTFYAVILAWAMSYLVFSVNLTWGNDPVSFFNKDYLQLAEQPGLNFDVVAAVLVPLLILWVGVIVILALGVRRGIELVNKVAIPLLVVIFVALVIRALFLPGALQGLDALFTPNWEALLDPNVWIAAYGQIFFSLSVAFGIMLTYSSYLDKKANLTATGYVAAFANSSFELLAGIGVFATLGFMAHQAKIPVSKIEDITGPTLSFVTFPKVISEMPGGPLFGVLFFLSLILAGVTSLISVIQVASAALQEKLNLNPVQGSLAIGIPSALVSIALFSTTNGLYALDVVDNFTNEVGVVASALISCVALTMMRKLPSLQSHLNRTSSLKVGPVWLGLVSVATPILLAYMLFSKLVSLIRNGYETYSSGFLMVFGWGALVVILVATAALTLTRWRTPVDDFIIDDDPKLNLVGGKA